MKKAVVISTLIAAGLAGCNRQQVTGQKVNGMWKMESHTINGTEQMGSTFEDAELVFEDCGGKESWCPMTYTEVSLGKTSVNEWTYRVSKDGKNLYVKDHIGNDSSTWEIDKLKGNVFNLKYVDDFDQDVHLLVLKR